MELFEYIKSQLPQMPNSAIMKSMGASEELIDYVKETPWNTNLNVMGSIASSGEGGQAEVWYSGNIDYIDSNTGEGLFNLTKMDVANTDALAANPMNYTIFVNGDELTGSGASYWSNEQFSFEVFPADEDVPAQAFLYKTVDATLDFFAEVSVKAK